MTANDLAQCADREALKALVRAQFAELSDDTHTELRGGRAAAVAALGRIRPQEYERTRNFLSGAVTQLSPYLRHGVLTLAEVRDHALAQAARPEDAGKLVQELAWRDYWQRLYTVLGEGVWTDREVSKTGFKASQYAAELPQALVEGRTTLACMDGFAEQLQQTGYLHNHARMWVAAYVVHWLKVRWQTGARWFLAHLLDGDAASNNLSWQWVASTFSAKPYIFNRENLERYTGGKFCSQCVHSRDRSCPFEAGYEDLSARLFPQLDAHHADQDMPTPPLPRGTEPKPSPRVAGKPLLWIHTDALNPLWPPFELHPEAPALFLWDRGWIAEEKISFKRVAFLAECLAEMPARLELNACGGAVEGGRVLVGAAQAAGATHILAARTPDPRLLAIAAEAERQMPVVWVDPPPFAPSREYDLKRFSRYWSKAQFGVMQPTRPM